MEARRHCRGAAGAPRGAEGGGDARHPRELAPQAMGEAAAEQPKRERLHRGNPLAVAEDEAGKKNGPGGAGPRPLNSAGRLGLPGDRRHRGGPAQQELG